MTSLAHRRHCIFFFFNDTATTEIYTLSLHDALPISNDRGRSSANTTTGCPPSFSRATGRRRRSEEHTSELQSRSDIVCRLLLEKNKKLYINLPTSVLINEKIVMTRRRRYSMAFVMIR